MCAVTYICCNKNKAKIQPAIPYTISSQFHLSLIHKSNASLIRVAINPDHIIYEKNTAKVVKKNDQRKCNCRSVLKYLRRFFDDFVIIVRSLEIFSCNYSTTNFLETLYNPKLNFQTVFWLSF